MDTQKRLHENISALADGELADSERELAFAALATQQGRAAWHAYHLAGVVLRAEAAGATLSGRYTTTLADRLAAEPAYVPELVSSPPLGQAAAAADAGAASSTGSSAGAPTVTTAEASAVSSADSAESAADLLQP